MDNSTYITNIPCQTIKNKNIYLVLPAGAHMDEILMMVKELKANGANVYIFPTVNAQNLLHHFEQYKDITHLDFNWNGPRKAIPEEDCVIVAPCTFNTLNKLSQGIADNYAMTITTTAIAKKKTVILALSVNKAMWEHPITNESISRLQSWGVDIIWPIITVDRVTMADYTKTLDKLYIEKAKINFNSVRSESDDDKKLLDESRRKYLKEFQSIGKTQETQGTNSLTNGNYSIKIPGTSSMLITATGSSLGKLDPEDLTLVKINDSLSDETVYWCGDKMPSCDTPMHIVYYKESGAMAIAHSHCPRMTYSLELEKFKTATYVRYGRFDTIKSTTDQLKENGGFIILKLHGETALGNSLDEAYQKINYYYKIVSEK